MDKNETHNTKIRVFQLIATTIVCGLLIVLAIQHNNMFMLGLTIICMICFDYTYIKEILGLSIEILHITDDELDEMEDLKDNKQYTALASNIIGKMIQEELSTIIELIALKLAEKIISDNDFFKEVCEDSRFIKVGEDGIVLECLIDGYDIKVSFNRNVKTFEKLSDISDLSVGINKSKTWVDPSYTYYMNEFIDKVLLDLGSDCSASANETVRELIAIGKKLGIDKDE